MGLAIHISSYGHRPTPGCKRAEPERLVSLLQCHCHLRRVDLKQAARYMHLIRPILSTILLVTMAVMVSSYSVGAQSPSVRSGFHLSVFASGFNEPTAMAIGPDKRLYVAQQNGVISVEGRSGVHIVASGFAIPLGLAWHSHRLYVSWTGHVSLLSPSKSRSTFTSRMIVSGLPTGKHQNDSIAFHDGWMYLGVGSTCNACRESDPRSATIMRFHPDGTHAQIFAHGLRNPFGLAFKSGHLYATDNGRDDFGDSVPDELNRVVQGGWYGWPNCWGVDKGSHCKGTIAPVALFEPHASADGLVFYGGKKFSKRYHGDGFVAEWGDSVNNLGTGHIVKDVHFTKSGAQVSTFATGFSHPIAVAVSPKGGLLVADWGTGIVWKIQPNG